MIDHMGFNVRGVQASKACYGRALEPLGIAAIMTAAREETGGPTHLG